MLEPRRKKPMSKEPEQLVERSWRANLLGMELEAKARDMCSFEQVQRERVHMMA